MKIDSEFKSLIPALTDEERSQLEENLRRDGCRDALVVWDGVLLDGHNRYEICKRLGIPYETREMEFEDRNAAKRWVIKNQFGRRNLSAYQRGVLALRMKETYAVEAKENQRVPTGGKSKTTLEKSTKSPLNTRSRIAAEAGVSDNTIHKIEKIEAEAPPEIKQQLERGELSVNQAHQWVKRRKNEEVRESRREENREIVRKSETPQQAIQNAKFSTIVIDPPWDFSEEGDDEQFGRANPTYSQMTEEQIAELPVGNLADEDAHLYLWITNRSLLTGKGWRLCEKWGFRPVTIITWVKPSIGVGNYFRNNTEHLVFAVKGSQFLKRRDMGTWFEAPRGKKHSEKPEKSYEIIESCSPGPYLEMFARSQREGWTAWGAEA